MPRRPGGKYKGQVGRQKGEDTLAAEAEDKARKAREEAVKRAQELKARALTAGHGLKSSKEEEEEAKKQRILNLLVGGKKSIKKMWHNWKVGVRQVQKELALHVRESSWRAACNCGYPIHTFPPHVCSAASMLHHVVFDLPFDASYRRAQLQASG